MLDSLAIKNFRYLKDFTIPSLGKVNLITGKNNTGKTAILEAIAIYSSNADLDVIYQLLDDRGEPYKQAEGSKDSTQINIRSFSSLFSNRNTGFEDDDAISIGSVNESDFLSSLRNENTVSLQFVRYVDEVQKDDRGISIKRSRIFVYGNISYEQYSDIRIGLQISAIPHSFILSLDKVSLPYATTFNVVAKKNFQYVNTRNVDRETNGKLFDAIALTSKEQHVINALKIIEPATERIAFVEEVTGRMPVIKLSNKQEVLPLRSMGDGINRILTIILALVNADNGYLLIDEFENGLHYTVQEQLWRIIFKLAQELNVQVFATTHSEDCIAAFSNVLNTPNQSLQGKLIRLDNVNGTIKQVEYDARELKIANDNNIETR